MASHPTHGGVAFGLYIPLFAITCLPNATPQFPPYVSRVHKFHSLEWFKAFPERKVDFRQTLVVQQVRQEASELYESLKPLLAVDPRLIDLILVDLARVLRICSRSKKGISEFELLAYLMLYALIKQDTEKLNAAQKWEFLESDSLSGELRSNRLKYQKIALQIILELTQNAGPIEQLTLPSIVNRLDEEKQTNYLESAVNGIYKFAQVVTKADGTVSMQEMEALSQIWQMLHSYQKFNTYEDGFNQAKTAADNVNASNPASPAPATSPSEDPSQILEKALAELHDLVGMDNIKEEVQTLTNFLKVQKIRAERGLAETPVSLHLVFLGPPGTGKTTVARLMGRIFHGLGFLDRGHLMETDRAGMVAGYVGQTAKKVEDLINSALDGVLFIDEAYALVPDESGRDFGQEAIDILLKRMEDYRDRMVVIVAGYTDEMLVFIESNPGLKSRFNRYFYFKDYTPEELLKIFTRIAEKSHFKLTPEASAKLQRRFTEAYDSRDRTFGNARMARNLFEKTIEKQANRLAVMSSLTDEMLTTLEAEDIP